MSVKDSDTLKSYFALSKVPTPSQYIDLIDTIFDQGSGSGGDHDHDNKYVKLLESDNIIARHIFAPSSPLSPFILSDNAQGKLVIGLKADQLNKSVFAGNGLTGGGILTSSITLDVSAGDGLSVGVDSISLQTPGTLSYNSTNNPVSNHTHSITNSSNPGASESILSTNSSGHLSLIKLNTDVIGDRSGSNIEINPTGDITLNPGGNDILPLMNYDLNLGSINKKFLTLHAAELWVETLVAQNTIATIGGRILIGPTTVLTNDLGTSQTNLVLNSGFETSGSGGSDVFSDWTESAPSGSIVKDTTIYYEGSASCKIVAGVTLDTCVYQDFSLTAGYSYSLRFWTRSDGGGYDLRYGVYDITHSSWIISLTGTGNKATSWERFITYFLVPSGCTSVRLYLYCTETSGYYGNFDAVLISRDTIIVKHNEMNISDVAYMEADGKVEFLLVTSTASEVSNGYQYSVVRDYDGSGLTAWYAGDAVFNTGTTDQGFIDLYSIRGVKLPTQYGPTIVGNVRSSLTYNDWIEHWAIGNLNGLYGYGVDTYGTAFGKYANSKSFLTIDATNGIRMRYRDGSGVLTTRAQWDLSGNVLIGQVGSSLSNIYISSGQIQLRNNTTVNIQLDTSGNATFGNVATNQGNMYWNVSNKRVEFRGGTDGTVVQAYVDTTGAISAGSGVVLLNSDGLSITFGNGDVNEIKFKSGSTKVGYIQFAGTSSDTSAIIRGGVNSQNGYVRLEAADAAYFLIDSNSSAVLDSYSNFNIQLPGDSNYVNILGGSYSTYLYASGRVDVGEDCRINGGLYVGGLGVDPGVGIIRCVYDLIADGGIIAGRNADPGDGNIQFTGSLGSYKNSTVYTGYIFIPLSTPLTSTSWDGDARSTTSKTLIDLSSVFGAPAGIKAVLCQIQLRDSGSAANDCYLILAAHNTAGQGSIVRCTGIANDSSHNEMVITACDANGDIYYQCQASGSSTLDIWLQIYGYWI